MPLTWSIPLWYECLNKEILAKVYNNQNLYRETTVLWPVQQRGADHLVVNFERESVSPPAIGRIW